ncbi:hypothetical protein K1T71_002907 [Dendrolimus kikuchii]|uniref:Uncharacterized protein n=1 Tax=Dendrolimus kikuchii TaxID=765133 RepID=A0ACC1DB57_9NEOP|nr:hypothetical protein K1T71_002907 [Dendrolimus kikuchii]
MCSLYYILSVFLIADTWRGQLVSHRWAGECAWTACGPRVARLRGVFGARAIDSLRAAAAARCWLRFRAAVNCNGCTLQLQDSAAGTKRASYGSINACTARTKRPRGLRRPCASSV